MLFQATIELNFGMSLIEALVAAFALYFIAGFLNNVLREDIQVTKRAHKLSSLMSSLINFGIILGVRLLLESISHYYIGEEYFLFRYLTNDFFLFAIMTTIFLNLYAFFLKKFEKDKFHDVVYSARFTGLFGAFIILEWIFVSIFFLLGLILPNIRGAMAIGGTISYTYAIISTILLPLYIFSLESIAKEELPDDENNIQSEQFRRLYLKFTIVAWIIGGIFLSSSLLQISLGSGDIFYLGFIWAIIFVGLAIIITYAVNKTRPIERRIPKFVLKQAMYTGGLISFGIWSIQLVIVELYLRRVFGITLYEQDIRFLILVVISLYFIFYYIFLKRVFMPQALERSELKIQKAFEIYDKKQSEELVSVGNNIILDVQDLTTYFYTEEGIVKAVEGVSFKIQEGETLGLVGETGCGKSVTALSILQVVRPPGKIEKGKVIFEGEDLLQRTISGILEYRGKDITMIFQDPLNSLNPVFKTISIIW